MNVPFEFGGHGSFLTCAFHVLFPAGVGGWRCPGPEPMVSYASLSLERRCSWPSCREATDACREGRAAWGITWCGQGISEEWQGEIPAASECGTGEEQDVSRAGFSNFLPWLKPRFSTEGIWLMAEKLPLALDDIYVDYLWVTFLGGIFFFFSPDTSWREDGMAGSLETSAETGSLELLVGEFKDMQEWQEEQGRKGRSLRRQESSSSNGTCRTGVSLWWWTDTGSIDGLWPPAS